MQSDDNGDRGKHARRLGTSGVLLVLMVAWSGIAAQTARVEFLSPKHQQTVLGETEIQLRVVVPEGRTVDRVEVSADGVKLSSLDAPPWTVTWNAGEAGGSHRLEAVLYLSDGSAVRASIQTSALQFLHVEEVSLVNLYALVRDEDGGYIDDLTGDAFRLFEDNNRQEIERFTTEHKPLRVAIVLDTSLTMGDGDKMEKAKKAALGFLQIMEEGDECMVSTFDDSVKAVQEMTDDRKKLSSAISSVAAKGGTALYDGIWRASRDLGEFDGRRVMILLSDGKDEASNGLEPGSFHTFAEALDRALRDEVMIFAIGLGRRVQYDLDFYGRRRLKSILEQLSVDTGGRALFPSRAGQLKNTFEKIADDLRNQYSIAYASNNDKRDGSWREIELEVKDEGLRVFTRRGYYAPKE